MNYFSKQLVKYIVTLGANLVGFALLSEISKENRWGYEYGISIAIAYQPKTLLDIKNIPNHEYYKEYGELDEKLENIALNTQKYLIEIGYEAKAITRENRCLDDTTKTSMLPYKTVATRAGLGWIGKCALLITKEYGAGLRFISVLTNAPLSTATPIDISNCEKCMECVKACPANAPVGINWVKGMDREEIFRAFDCSNYIAERGIKYEYGRTSVTCGLCILACPWTKKYINSSEKLIIP